MHRRFTYLTAIDETETKNEMKAGRVRDMAFVSTEKYGACKQYELFLIFAYGRCSLSVLVIEYTKEERSVIRFL
jgi:hypothetical protein